MGKRGPKPSNRISTIWSPKLAYVVGLIASDGSLSKDGRHIDFTSKDYDLVATFRQCLDLESVKIGRKNSGAGNLAFHCQFGSVLFYQWLQEIGLTQRKSKTIGPLDVPDELFFDFLRGVFDGDGTIYSYWDKRWRDSYMFYMTIASASLKFIKWLRKTTKRLIGLRGHVRISRRPEKIWYQLAYGKAATKKLFQQMYLSSDIPHLERKRKKAENIFAVDNQHNARVV